MFSMNQKISVRQLQALLIINVFGASIILLPRQAAHYGGQDGWLIVAACTAAAFVLAILISSVSRMFPEDSFVVMTSKILSNPVGKFVGVLFSIKLVLNGAVDLRLFAEIINQTLLESTPIFVVCAVIAVVSAYAASKGMEARARLAQILLPLILLPMLFVFVLAAFQSDFSNIKPVFDTEPKQFGWGVFHVGSAFTALELVLLSHHYIQKPSGVRRGVLQAVLLIGGVMTLITLITIAQFGPIDLTRQLWPVLEMMDIMDLPGSFIDRQDALVMSFWILSIFAVVNTELFYSSVLLKDVFAKGTHSFYIIVSLIAALGLSCLPVEMSAVYQIKDFLYKTLDMALLVALPMLLYAIAKIRKLGAVR